MVCITQPFYYKFYSSSSLHPKVTIHRIYNLANVISVLQAAEKQYCKFAQIQPSAGVNWQVIHLAHCTLSGML